MSLLSENVSQSRARKSAKFQQLRTNSMGTHQAGFTLLELVIAIGITVFIGIGTAMLTQNMGEAKDRFDDRSDRLKNLQRLMLWISRDIEQLANRSIRDEYGDVREALYLNTEPPYFLEFTRNGWPQNPISTVGRSNFQRVAYELRNITDDACESAYLRVTEKMDESEIDQLKGNCLLRYYWTSIDRSPDAEPKIQVLYDLINELEVEILYKELQPPGSDVQTNSTNFGDWTSDWPPTTLPDLYRIKAFRLTFDLPFYGEMERLFEVSWNEGRNVVVQ